MKKAIHTISILFLSILLSSEIFACPDPPINDEPCINSDLPPIDLTDIGSHSGTTCCATHDYENQKCISGEESSVWYYYTPDLTVEGYTIRVNALENVEEGPLTVELRAGTLDEACSGGLFVFDIFGSSCSNGNIEFKIGNCYDLDDKIFIKVSTSTLISQPCGEFSVEVEPEMESNQTDNCIDLVNQTAIEPITNPSFSIDYTCMTGNLNYTCPENNIVFCPEFAYNPAVWFKVKADNLASQMFTTVETNGDWDAVWTVYSGSDCDNLVLAGSTESLCSNGDNTPQLHENSVNNESDYYWVAVTVDPISLTSEGIGDGSFELCVATTVNAIICLGELEGGSCDDESLFIDIVDRDNEALSLEGPFCPGEEVTVNISFFYDATGSGADWLIGFVPKFGKGWDLEQFDFNANTPTGNGQSAQWYEEGSELGPIIQESVPILCTYRDVDGVLQICNQLCEPCIECEEQGMQPGDALPSGYFWVQNGANEGCDNDGSPGEGWGIGSITTQIDWTLTLRVKTFENLDDCLIDNDLSISFQTFSDGVAGCWEDPIGECLLDRAMVSPPWRIGCAEIPPGILADDLEICTKQNANITVSTDDGSSKIIVVEAIENPFVTGANNYEFDDSISEFSDFLVNTNTVDEIVEYEVYALDSALECRGPKTIISVLVKSQYITGLDKEICDCMDGCTLIGVDEMEGNSYQWNTGENTSMITVCPTTASAYFLTVTDESGCEKYGSVLVDCEGGIEECQEPVFYKLIYDFFADIDADGIRDAEENSFGGGSFSLGPQNTFYYNTGQGEDDLYLLEGDYSLVFAPYNLDCWALSTDSIIEVTLDSIQNCVRAEFGVSPTEQKRNVFLSHYLASSCNSDRLFHVSLENKGTQIESGVIWVTLDEEVLSLGFPTGSTIDTFVAPNMVGWFFEDLYPGNKTSRSVLVSIPGPPDFEIGGILNHVLYSELNNDDGTAEIWGERDVYNTVLCAYDPNDKAVEPSHEEGYTNINQDELIFKIRFQNVGNAPAEDIQIRDTLSEFLDVLSVQYIQGSHDDHLTFSRIGERELIFDFNNINLPDSTADLEASQGYLLYRVSILDGLPEGTLIENTAHIYFDNNPPIVTNTTTNLLYSDLDGDGYFSIVDCDEENLEINPGAEEIPNNDVDEDCDGVALIIDNDMDGFNSDEDCDDENPDINPAAEEIINNLIDENCDDLVVIIDSDMDGFNSDDDCDDENPDINPNAEDIPGNGIDEDCDGEDAVVIAANEEQLLKVSIRPNPSNDAFNINLSSTNVVDYVVRDLMGRVVKKGKISPSDNTVYLGEEPNGVYLIALFNTSEKVSSFHKLLKI